MKLKTTFDLKALAQITLAGLLVYGGASATAATRTWDGASGGDWNDAVNWSADTAPIAGDTVIFNTTLASVTNASANQSALHINFDGAAGTNAGSFTIGTVAGNALILGNGGTTEILATLTGSAKIISINAPITLNPASTSSDGIYTLSNNSSDTSNGLQITGTLQAAATTGTETLELSGSNTGASNILSGVITNGDANAFALYKTGAGSWNIDTHSNVHNNYYTGGTTLSGGTLQVNAVVNEHTLGSGLVTFDGGTLLATGWNPILDNDVVVNSVLGNVVTANADLHLTGDITGSGTLTYHYDSGAALLLEGDNNGFTGTYVASADGYWARTYFTNPTAGSANAAWVVNNRGLASNVTGGATIHLGSLASTNVNTEIGNHGGGSLTFEIGENNASTQFRGAIRDLSGYYATDGGTTAIVKDGSGTLLITNVYSNYSGGTTINEGILGTDHSDGWGATFGSGPITLNGGTLLADTSHELPNNIIVNPVSGNQINLGQNSSTFTGNLSGSGDVFVIQTGGGWTAFNGNNSGFSGTFTADVTLNNNLFFSPTATSDAAAWVLNCAGVVGGNSQSGNQTLNFGSLAGTNPDTQLGDGYSSLTLIKIGARNENAEYAGKIMDAWYGSGTTRVTKVGSGTQTLSGTLTYKGNTIIEDGVLSIATPNFDDTSTVTIGTVANSPAVLDLPNEGTDIVASLVIDGVAQITGKVYGNSSSVLPVVATTAITGPGKIQVGAIAGTDYDTWMSTYPSLTGGDQLPTADPDHDGILNQQEYAFGLAPNSGSSINPILVQLDKTTGTFSYQRRASTGLTYRILTSSNLSTWLEDTAATASQSAGTVDGNGIQTVVVTLSDSKPLTATKKFVRVAAE